MNTTKEEYIPKTISQKQQLFLRYFTAVLIDLTVLNFFAEYWDRVTVTSFGISLLVAVVLQILLKLSIALEHHIGQYFASDTSVKMKIYRILSAWTILFVSKLVILGALQFIFSDAIVFAGAYHGVVAFLVVVIAMLLAEYLVARIYRALA